MNHDLISKMRTKQIKIVDVRTVEEYKAGHIPGAILISVDQIATQKTQLNPQEEFVIYCQSGSRSAFAKIIFNNFGYQQVIDFGSINNWPDELEI